MEGVINHGRSILGERRSWYRFWRAAERVVAPLGFVVFMYGCVALAGVVAAFSFVGALNFFLK